MPARTSHGFARRAQRAHPDGPIMPKFAVTRRVAHAAQEMFDLVADVERYPEFVPLWEKLTVRSRRQENGKTVLIADTAIGYRSIRESFTTRVTLDPAGMAIDFGYLTGPFRRLSGLWQFEPQGPGECLVHFSLDYEFRSRLLAMLMGALFDQAFRRFAAAFEARADEIYGVSV
jgi:coenzyme Q-binding protein COQ10